jgi:hypothetical protein
MGTLTAMKPLAPRMLVKMGVHWTRLLEAKNTSDKIEISSFFNPAASEKQLADAFICQSFDQFARC